VSKQRTDNYKKRASKHLAANQVLPQHEAKLPLSKHFVRLRHRIGAVLQAALDNDPESVRKFFKLFPFISPDDQQRISLFIKKVNDASIRRSLREYVQFALRFHVRFILESKAPFFRVESVRLAGVKFRGTVENGLLLPITESLPADIADFQDTNLKIPAGSESLFESGKAKLFVIDDPSGDSLLADIEDVSYHDEAIVFVLHHCGPERQPFLFCLVGESVSYDDWKKAAQVKTRFQQEQYGTGTRGRLPDLEKRSKEYGAVQSQESLKSIAADFAIQNPPKAGDGAKLKHVDSARRELSRRKSELKKPD
jgi:hypothetical protein